MKRRKFLCAFCAPLLLSGQEPVPQQPNSKDEAEPPKPQFFAGVVIEADGEHVKVSRSLLGHPAETHLFSVDGKTKTPKGGIKVKSRVTVRYEHWPERDLALEIQVRPANHTQKTT